MKRVFSICVAACLLLVSGVSHADTRITGKVNLDKRLNINDWFGGEDFGTPQVGMYNLAELKLESWLNSDLQTVVSGQVRFYDVTGVTDAASMADAGHQFEFEVIPWEIYVRAYGVFVEGLDFSLGKQRIAWGKADRLNPTDNLNPDDWSDIFDFGAHVPSTSALVSYTFPNDFSLQLVWVPAVRPVLLSRSIDLSTLMGDTAELEQRMGELEAVQTLGINPVVTSYNDRIIAPPFDLEHSMQAARFAFNLFDFDFSVSYFHGYDDVPVPKNVVLSSDTEASLPGDMDFAIAADVEAHYMGKHVIGFDTAGDLFGLGVWAEVAVVIPDGINTRAVAQDLVLDYEATEERVSDDVYAQYTVGIDYHFDWSMYVNLQYAHGFPFELGKDAQNDYFILKLDQNFMYNTLRLTLQGGFAVAKWDDLANQHGYLINPEIAYKPFDNLEFLLGAYILEGEGDGLFAMMDDLDQLYVKAQARF